MAIKFKVEIDRYALKGKKTQNLQNQKIYMTDDVQHKKLGLFATFFLNFAFLKHKQPKKSNITVKHVTNLGPWQT